MVDATFLSRVQFGFTIGFHILWPTLTLGLAYFLVIMETLWLTTKNPVYLQICRYWSKIFALTFGMGVVSGVVLAYELGTNFSRFSYTMGNILGPLLGYEVLSAFFLEAGFLGVMLFGWNRVSAKLHYGATLLVAIGVTLSAFWIISANSWMQAPTSYELVGDQFFVKSWFEVVFNPTFIPRFIHMILASSLTTCFFIAGICAYYCRKDIRRRFVKRCFYFVIIAAAIIAPLQFFVGDVVGLNVLKYQPLKTAAMEGIWDTTRGAPFLVFAIPSPKQEKNFFEIKIPYGAALINTHSIKGKLVGLKSVAPEDRPIVVPVFFAFRIMLGIGSLMLLTAFWGLWLIRKKTLLQNKLFHWLCLLVSPLGFVATLAGWITAESGRQPWAVNGLLRTADSASEVPVAEVWGSLIIFILVYGVVLTAYLIYLFKTIRTGPTTIKLITESEETHPSFFLYMQGNGHDAG